MWLWLIGTVLSVGGVLLARAAFTDEAFLGPVLAWGFVGLGMIGSCMLVYKASTIGILG